MTDEPAACYGMGCPQRGQCQRYEALGIDDGIVWAHCWNGASWAKFVPIQPAKE
jgi:hypothetical protein